MLTFYYFGTEFKENIYGMKKKGFDSVDRDRDGYIEREDLFRVFNGPHANDFIKFDTDGDKKMSYGGKTYCSFTV